MELNINEFDQDDDDAFLEEYLQENLEHIEDIPENTFSKTEPKNQRNTINKVNLNQRKQVQFDEHIKPMHQSIPKTYAKMVRPKVPPEQPKVSYDDILLKMGMFVADGKLHLNQNKNKNQNNKSLENQNQNQDQVQQVPDNSYIYNKYFNSDLSNQEPTVRVPKNLQEYRDMLIHDIIQKKRIKQIKSTKLFLPTQNIHFAPNTNANMNLNRLFNFSNR